MQQLNCIYILLYELCIAIMRTFFTLKQQIIPLLAELLPVLTDKLAIVARNPSQPEFNHFLFETISFCVK